MRESDISMIKRRSKQIYEGLIGERLESVICINRVRIYLLFKM